jgi:predicted ATP-grasp superfamily ATP-dependent carboligase
MLKALIEKLFKKCPPQVELVMLGQHEAVVHVSTEKLLQEIKRLQTQVNAMQGTLTKMHREMKERR